MSQANDDQLVNDWIDAQMQEDARQARYLSALQQIAALDPEEDTEDGYNEWGEAACFNKAQAIAKTALRP